MKQKIIERLKPFRKKAEAELELAEVNLYNLLGSSVGVAEHLDLTETGWEGIGKIAQLEDNLKTIDRLLEELNRDDD